MVPTTPSDPLPIVPGSMCDLTVREPVIPALEQGRDCAVERLIAESACRDVVLAAADAVDRQDTPALIALFTADGTLVRPDGVLLQGREAIHAAYAARSADRLTRHLVCNHVVQVGPTGMATSRCTILLWSGRRGDPETPKGRPADVVQQVGEITDQLVLTPEGWRIRRRDARFAFHSGVGG